MQRAEQALRDAQFDQAHAAYRAVLAENPDLPDAWYNLAWVQRALRAFDEALKSYAEAISRGVARPEEAHLNRATILSEHLNQTAAAVQEVETALSLNPRFVQAWLNLGSLREDLGQPDPASAAYRQVLEIDPSNGRAHGRLGMIDVRSAEPGRVAERLKAALPSAPTLADRAEILFALGTAFDADALYDDAFQAFEAANWMARSASQSRYDPIAHERLIDRLIDTFSSPMPVAVPVAGTAPLFICGMFRSGSTLAEQILARHPAITSGGELDYIPALARNSLQPYPEAMSTISGSQVARTREDYLTLLATVGLDTGLVTDKRCDNFLHIGLIKAIFPEAKIVHTHRQPLDNLLSIYFLHFGEGVAYGHDLREAAHHYIQYRRMMDHWHRLFPGDIFDLAYDEVVTDPQPIVADALRFLGLEWSEACLSTDAKGPVRTASTWQVRQPLFTRSSGRWRNYERHLGPALDMLEAAGLA